MPLLPYARGKYEEKILLFVSSEASADAALCQGTIIDAPKLYQMPTIVKLLVFSRLGHTSTMDAVY
ncbi:hypothetical protein H6G27_12900 [Nostoc linckia FACHB-104]|nr:hypothetical protein [Nostoc linckia FACHB-104]